MTLVSSTYLYPSLRVNFRRELDRHRKGKRWNLHQVHLCCLELFTPNFHHPSAIPDEGMVLLTLDVAT